MKAPEVWESFTTKHLIDMFTSMLLNRGPKPQEKVCQGTQDRKKGCSVLPILTATTSSFTTLLPCSIF